MLTWGSFVYKAVYYLCGWTYISVWHTPDLSPGYARICKADRSKPKTSSQIHH